MRLGGGELTLGGGTHQGTSQASQGGVGRNLAVALGLLGTEPRLASAVGGDQAGAAMIADTAAAGVDTSLVLQQVMCSIRLHSDASFCAGGGGHCQLHRGPGQRGGVQAGDRGYEGERPVGLVVPGFAVCPLTTVVLPCVGDGQPDPRLGAAAGKSDSRLEAAGV